MADSIEHRPPRITPRASALALPRSPALDDEALARRLHPDYAAAVRRFPDGPVISRGLPFEPPAGGGGRRWMALDAPLDVDGSSAASTHLVLLQFCDAWRDEDGRRPPGAPIGWVLPVGEPLARVHVELDDGEPVETVLRRRFEVNEGLIGWGSMAFLAVPHLVEAPLDWRGPHPRQVPGAYAAPGHSGPLTILPGAWGAAQTGVQDHIPSATGDLMLWLHAIDLREQGGAPRSVRRIRFEPIPGQGSGRLVVLAGITAFVGSDSPLRWEAREAFRVEGGSAAELELDLGLVARRGQLRDEEGPRRVTGWGVGGRGQGETASLIELTAAADAILAGDGAELPLLRLRMAPGPVRLGQLTIARLAAPEASLDVTVRDADGDPVPARVRCLALDGRPMPPQGHRVEVNPAIYEDIGADVILGGATYAYVDGSFRVMLPPDGARLEVVRGPEVAPVRVEVSPDDLRRGWLEIRLDAPLRPAGEDWVSGDTHVHFLAPSTALLQARAENVNVVHLLATKWGDLDTNVTDLGADLRSRDLRHAVWVGSENRQNMLGHVGIVGTSSPVMPFASGGPPEGPIGNPVSHLMADWLARCRALGGLAIGAHFPLPMAEVAADIDAGLLDALELQCFDLGLESPPIAEWYRYLDAGYRLPMVGGTDKMSAEVPLGQVRTWARLADGATLDLAAWAEAIRAGRTTVTSGPLLDLEVEGVGPGETLERRSGDVLEVTLRARAAQPVISDLELVVDGRVVAAEPAREPVSELSLLERIRVEGPGWVAARSRSPFAIGSAFATAMAAHTSPVYLEVLDRPRRRADLATPLAIVDGTRAWLEHLAPVRDPAERERFRRFLDAAEQNLRRRAE